MRLHTEDENCWCKPVLIFNAGYHYGKVYVHRLDGIAIDPGKDTMIYAVMKALFEEADINIVEKETNVHNN